MEISVFLRIKHISNRNATADVSEVEQKEQLTPSKAKAKRRWPRKR